MKLRTIRRIHPKRLAQAVFYRLSPRRRCFCSLCGRRVSGFMPYPRQRVPRLMQALSGVGSNLDDFECPWCGCHDRERHVFLYMTAMGFLPDLSGRSVLHFAPEKRLQERIIAAAPEEYVKCDLFPRAMDVVKMDIHAIPFAANRFDLVIANHVLEHVSDDRQALGEISRVLKPGGFAILQTPFSAKLHQTWEDHGVDTEEARFEAYGQEDHLRLYGRDVFQRICEAGFESCVVDHQTILTDKDPGVFGVNLLEPFFLFRRVR
jgi:SAM-dependent methyltransferase